MLSLYYLTRCWALAMRVQIDFCEILYGNKFFLSRFSNPSVGIFLFFFSLLNTIFCLASTVRAICVQISLMHLFVCIMCFMQDAKYIPFLKNWKTKKYRKQIKYIYIYIFESTNHIFIFPRITLSFFRNRDEINHTIETVIESWGVRQLSQLILRTKRIRNSLSFQRQALHIYQKKIACL